VTVPTKVPICWPGLHPPAKSISNEKRILLSAGSPPVLILNIGRYKRTSGPSTSEPQVARKKVIYKIKVSRPRRSTSKE
jgi:hypothetical protein